MWIAWSRGLIRKAEVLLISRALECSQREAAAMCMEVWEWAEDQTDNGVIEKLCSEDVSRAVGIPGVGEAMEAAGWLHNGNGMVIFPNWDRFNSKCAKKRLLAVERTRRWRRKKEQRTAESDS
jgi:hypothetical protein